MNTDYLLDPTTGDLMIKDGDFVVGPSDDQHIEDTIVSFPGEYKEHPFIGAGIITSINAADIQGSINRVKAQLQSVGYQLDLLNISVDEAGKLRIQFPQGITYNGNVPNP